MPGSIKDKKNHLHYSEKGLKSKYSRISVRYFRVERESGLGRQFSLKKGRFLPYFAADSICQTGNCGEKSPGNPGLINKDVRRTPEVS